MATTENTITGSASIGPHSFTFPYIKADDVKVTKTASNGTVTTLTKVDSSPIQDQYTQATTSITLGENTLVATDKLRIYRLTSDTDLTATFYPGSAIRSTDLNDNFTQNLYSTQEVVSRYYDVGGTISLEGNMDAATNKITNLGEPTDQTDAANKDYVDNGTYFLAGTDLTKTLDVTPNTFTIDHDAVGASSVNNSDGTVIQDLTISATGHITNHGSVNLDGRYYTEAELDAGKLDNRYYTESEAHDTFLSIEYSDEVKRVAESILTVDAIGKDLANSFSNVDNYGTLQDNPSLPDYDPVTVSTGTSDIQTVADSIDNVDNVGGSIANVNKVSEDLNLSYTRQLSPQTGTSLTHQAASSNSPYSDQDDEDAQIYNYLWDNKAYFDFDGDGIVSPTDGMMFYRMLVGAGSHGGDNVKNGLYMSANATRTDGDDIWAWFEDHRDNTTIDRGTYSPPDGSADVVIGTKGVYDIDASSGTLAALNSGLLVVRVFGAYDDENADPKDISSTSTYLTPHDSGPAVWNSGTSTWDWPGTSKITTVYNDIKVGGSNNTNTVADAIANVNAVGTDIANVNLLAQQAVRDDMAALAPQVVRDDMAILGADGVADDMAALGATGVVGDMHTIVDTEDLIEDIGKVADDSSSVGTVSTHIANVNTVATDLGSGSSKITTVYNDLNLGNSSNIKKVADDITKVNTVSTNIDDVDTVATDLGSGSSKITEVYNDLSGDNDIGTVADDIGNVNALAVQAVRDNMSALAPQAVRDNMSALGTQAVRDDMSALAPQAVRDDMAALNVTSVLADMSSCRTNISTINSASANATAAEDAKDDAVDAKNSAETYKGLAETAKNGAESAEGNAQAASSSAVSAKNDAETAEAGAEAARDLAEDYKDLAASTYSDTAGLYTQQQSTPYNLADNVSTHPEWGDLSSTLGSFANETTDTLLTMAEGSSSYNYGDLP